ncbi:ATP-grasp domain-containing protein [Neorickettsia helminthoeca]|uniref:glutathione synthetase n=1 Tax=Neorickettsia helminthoeca TaxID=33994 RepID=UPI00056E266B|nr:glutathione synthetase [Neorickettsia helminthoeca]
MKIGIQVISLSNLGKSTTYLIGEALERECNIFIYPVETLSIWDGRVSARGKMVTTSSEGKVSLSEKEEEVNLSTLDMLLMRNDPPFDMSYITATYMLERCGTLVINEPEAVRGFPEKFVDYYNDAPPTLISREIRNIQLFFEQYKSVVLKPLYEFGGDDVMKFESFDESTQEKIHELISKTGTPIVAQKFEESVLEDGDKRVVVLDGKLLGCFRRKKEGSFITNMCKGGDFSSCILTSNEEEKCYRIASDLKERGITLAGIDLIAEKITEINVTSIAGIAELHQLYHINSAAKCFDVFEEMIWLRKK